MKRYILIIIFLVLSGCSLVTPGNFEEDVANANKQHKAKYDQWMKNKGITERDLVGMTKIQVKSKLGNPDRVSHHSNSTYCQNQMKNREVVEESCKGESWVYTNWYGIPYVSGGFAQYSVSFDKNGIVEKFDGYQDI